MDTIITDLKNGIIPWRRFSPYPYYLDGMPLAATDAIIAQDAFWGTMEQWVKLGGYVAGEPLMLSKGQFYPISQVAGVNMMPQPVNAKFNFARIRYVSYPIAQYDRDKDCITMQKKALFSSNEAFYDTLFHELMHWTENRLSWRPYFWTSNNNYDLCELRAELGSCFISRMLHTKGLPITENHKKRQNKWIDFMRDKKFFNRIAEDALEGARLVINVGKMKAAG